jgi:hypothetical protein
VIVMPVSDSARAARRIRGCLGTRGEVVPGGVVLWSEEGCGEWKADARELSDDLMLLGVPHYATMTRRCQPPWRTPQTKKLPAVWVKLWITGDDFGHLAEAIPSLGRLEVPPADPPHDVTITRSGYVIEGEQLAWVVGSPNVGDLPDS